MKRTSMVFVAAASMASSLLAASFTETVYTIATNTYDENTIRTATITSSLTAYNVAAFKTDLATAVAEGRGGVITFDRAESNTTNAWPTDAALYTSGTNNKSARVGTVGLDTYTGQIKAKYNGGSNIVTITPANSVYTPFAMGSASPISGFGAASVSTSLYPVNPALVTGSSYGALGNGNGTESTAKPFDLTFAFDNANASLDKLAFTYIGRSNGAGLTNASTTTITCYYSGGGTSVLSTQANNVLGQRFAAFAAPVGQSITRLTIDSGVSDRQVMIDDLAFVTVVPEPAALGVVALASTMLLRRKPR